MHKNKNNVTFEQSKKIKKIKKSLQDTFTLIRNDDKSRRSDRKRPQNFSKLHNLSTYSAQINEQNILQNNDDIYKLIVDIRANNIFCTLRNATKQTTIFSRSAGKYGINVTKNKIKLGLRTFLHEFITDISFIEQKVKVLFIYMAIPQFLRETILWTLKPLLKSCNTFVEIRYKKTFNGCRLKKLPRKKNFNPQKALDERK